MNNLKDYFKENVSFDAFAMAKLNKLYKTGKFRELNQLLLARDCSAWEGKQQPTKKVLSELRARIIARHCENIHMNEFLEKINQVEATANPAGVLEPEQEEYFNRPGKFLYFLQGNEDIHSYIRKYGDVLEHYRQGRLLSVVFVNGEVACFNDTQDLANTLTQIHGMELGIKSNHRPPIEND